MNVEIKNILRLLIKEKVVTASWGISDIRILANSITFSVEAMIYQGVVEISPINATDCIVWLSDKKEIRCSIKSLVPNLDKLIESSDNYYANLLNWFNQ